MARRNGTRGTYYFESGWVIWYNGLSAREKANAIAKYGKIVRFIPD